ncbi:Brp/Blh family beta-carotene 15,15'-dioxygenase [Streptomyces griseomycini]|uniref:Probable beta-carotene 15,15'-dioxygenase n=1 Tax=Streptomyces griseomycini TaxID=66895 RepID=A0A7W7PWL1_9ACTN|nr:Brp/Blh family beta-carotene 15,15'-dioxygenase [Streptomyces griseomycini]MBB4902630.1 Brp/Blh family beta-carotene 15,15'-monooxygenase [Streptomyces griseomycini]GGR60031.1 beta-carotene 15,15'-dioxygenase [Streptomyces griseomycini]
MAAPGPAARVLVPAGRISTGAVAAVLAVGLVAPQVWRRWAVAVFLTGLVAGLPHGAVDHLVPGWFRRGSRPAAGHRTVVPLGYAAAAAAVPAAALTVPACVLCVFLAVSALHFGYGDARFCALRDGPTDPAPRAVHALAHGTVTAVLPLALWPEQVRPVVRQLAPGADWLLAAPVRTATAVLAGAAVAVCCGMALRDGRHRQAAELLLLTALFGLVPPLVAFGTYFGAWHSVRHIARLVLADPANAPALRAGHTAAVLRRFGRQAAVPTAIALAALAFLTALPRAFLADGRTAVGGVVLLAALTFPHLIVVAHLDRGEGRPEPGPGRPSPPRAARRAAAARSPSDRCRDDG